MADLQLGGRRRVPTLDVARGIAILAMIVFHLAWDLFYFGYSSVDVTIEPGWVVFQKTILSSFLLLTGASLVLGHGKRVRWRPFWRRFALLAAAALATTIGTYLMFPEFFVYFGVLHAIAAFSLLGLLFLRLPVWTVLLVAALFIVPHFFIAAEVMREKWLSWIGFWTYSPYTTDIVPVFPWAGVTLLGIAGMKVLLRSPLWKRIAAWEPGPALGWLAFAGRWSLVIYLVHQPLLIGGFNLLQSLEPAIVAPEVLPEGGFDRR